MGLLVGGILHVLEIAPPALAGVFVSTPEPPPPESPPPARRGSEALLRRRT